eukprot:213275_1
MIFRLLLLLIIICIDSVASGKKWPWSIKIDFPCVFCHCGSMDGTSGPDHEPHFQRRTRNKTKVNQRETEEPEPLERRRQSQPQQQRRLRTPVAQTRSGRLQTPKNRLVSFNLSKVDDMSTLPESDGSDSTFESTTTSATTKRQTSFQTQNVLESVRKTNSFDVLEIVRSLPVVQPFGSQKRTPKKGPASFTRVAPFNPLIPAANRNRSTKHVSDDPLFIGVSASNQKQIVDYCKTIVATTIIPKPSLSFQEVMLNKACCERFVELIYMVEQPHSEEIVIDDSTAGNFNNTLIALDLSSIVSTHGEVKGVATEDDLMELLQAFTSLNAMVRNKAVYTPWVYSVVQRHSMPDVYAVYSYRNHFMKFMDTVRDDTVGVYVNLNVNNSLTVSGSRNGSILAHLYHVVALEMIYNHAQSGTPFEFAFVSFPAADEQHAHAIFHVLSAWPQRFWSSATRLMIVDSNGDKAWDVITPEELDEELRCKKMRLRNFVPILAKQAPSFRLAHDPSILVVTASRIKLDLIRGTFEQIANDNFWLHAQMMGEVLTGGYRRPWLHNSVAKVISWTDTEMGGDLTTV